MYFARIIYLFAITAFGGLLVGGCDDAFIDPFANQNKYYTVYGYLDQTRNFEGGEQFIRVVPVTRQSARIVDPASPQASIDARVFTIDLFTGQEIEWTHQLETLNDGSYGHIFNAHVFVQANHTYRLEIRRSDGIVTYGETRVPIVSSIVPERAVPRLVENSVQSVEQDISLPRVGAAWGIEMIYHIGGGSCIGASIYRIDYGRIGSEGSAGWQFTARISKDLNAIAGQIGTSNFTLCAMGVRAKILDENWDFPEGELDLNLLANPNALTNIVNGYGFFGSIALLQFDWPVSDDLASLLD